MGSNLAPFMGVLLIERDYKMAKKDIRSLFNQYLKWAGSKDDLLKVLDRFETEFPEEVLYRDKKTDKRLKVNARRIKQFSDDKIIPHTKGRLYDSEHVVKYLAAVRLKNEGQLMKQLTNLMTQLSEDEIESIAFSNDKSVGKSLGKPVAEILTSQFTTLNERLAKLGRPEGRALRTQVVRFAITPWCHVKINKKKLRELSKEDCMTLAEALQSSLLETVELAKNGRLDSTVG